MGTLSARNLTQALSQARNVGLVEEPFVVADTSLVVRNLRPDEYDSIYKECQGLQDVEYMNTWQLGHVCRAIVEINGVDLRDTQFVEDEVPDEKRPGKTRTLKLELHDFLRKNVCSTWGREVLFIVYRKVADAVEAAEKKSQEGITFRIADESAEDKFRRLIAEAKEVENDVPERLRDGILAEHGYTRRSTIEEYQKAEEKLSSVAETPVAETPVVEEPPVEEPHVEPPQAGPPSAERLAHLLRTRVPMNQQPAEEAMPMPQTTPIQPQITAQPQAGPPPTPSATQASLSGRAAEYAALETSADSVGVLSGAPLPVKATEVPELRLGSNPKMDPQAAIGIIDTMPQGGINPRFRPPSR